MTIIPVILSGGSGTRLWPLSIATTPKQFLPLTSERTMIQETLLRLEGLETANPIIICNQAHRFIVAEQITAVSGAKPYIMLEPLARNTAPAIAVGAHQALVQDKDAVMVVLPSDHVIADKAAFQKAVLEASKEALKGSLVTFGIVPTMPHTGYGYIKTSDKSSALRQAQGPNSQAQGPNSQAQGPNSQDPQCIIYNLEKFVEKPDLETAKKYLAEGTYSWNSGMFVFKAQSFLDELAVFEPEMSNLSEQAFKNAQVDQDFIRIDQAAFEKIKGNSIDYAVMERTKKGKVIKLNAGWDDVGSWSALWEISNKDADGNVTKGKSILMDTKNSYFNTKKTVAAIGLENLIVVESEDAILVSRMDKCQDVKKAAEQFNK